MKLEMQMTERDKKLLIFLSMFVVVVCVGYWVLLPIVKSIHETDQQIEDAKMLKQENDMKINMLPILETDTNNLEVQIEEAKKDFYPMMTSDEVDKMMTGIALQYNLNAFDLDIYMPSEESSLEAYKYAKPKEEPEEEDDLAEETDEESSIEATSTDVTSAEEEEQTMTGIYCVSVSMRLGGDEAMLQKLIDDYSNLDQKILLKSYSWSTEARSYYSEGNEEYELAYERTLNVSFELFMCED